MFLYVSSKKKPQTKAENPSVVVQSEQSVSMVLLCAWSSPVLPELPLGGKSRKFLGQHHGVCPSPDSLLGHSVAPQFGFVPGGTLAPVGFWILSETLCWIFGSA